MMGLQTGFMPVMPNRRVWVWVRENSTFTYAQTLNFLLGKTCLASFPSLVENQHKGYRTVYPVVTTVELVLKLYHKFIHVRSTWRRDMHLKIQGFP